VVDVVVGAVVDGGSVVVVVDGSTCAFEGATSRAKVRATPPAATTSRRPARTGGL
jgi:hypothetical protein